AVAQRLQWPDVRHNAPAQRVRGRGLETSTISDGWSLVQSHQGGSLLALSEEATMKRNMDLVRFILIEIENSPLGKAVPPFGLLAFKPEDVRYHLHLMTEDGLIEDADVTPNKNTATDEVPRVLTAKGHDFLDLARDRNRWNQAHVIIRKVGSAPIA